MWFEQKCDDNAWLAAARHLAGIEPKLARLIGKVGPCMLAPREDCFVVLCRAIYSQQLATKVAAVLYGRFADRFPRKQPTPRRVVELLKDADETLTKQLGLSRQKKSYLLDLARHFADGRLNPRRLRAMDDAQVVEALTAVHGIGRWTAEMFLIFTLNRPDVWPVDDLGLRKGVQQAFGLKQLPTAKQLMLLAEPWRPYRSVATWYLWRGLSV